MSNVPRFYDRTRFWKFVLLEKEVSLKLVFDNVKNFSIAAAILAAARIYQGSCGTRWEPWGMIGLGVALIAVNSLQTWLLILRMFYHFTTIDDFAEGWKNEVSSFIKVSFLMAALFGIPFLTWRMITVLLARQ